MAPAPINGLAVGHPSHRRRFPLLLGHVAAFLPYVKRLKLGQAEIELQEKLGDLSKNVKQLEDAPEKAIHHASPTTTDVSETSIESTILDIASKDKAAALIRLGIEIEKRLDLKNSKVTLADFIRLTQLERELEEEEQPREIIVTWKDPAEKR